MISSYNLVNVCNRVAELIFDLMVLDSVGLTFYQEFVIDTCLGGTVLGTVHGTWDTSVDEPDCGSFALTHGCLFRS